MAFIFHHNEDQAWIDVLKALFDAGYVLVATYPVRSNKNKDESAAFGSQKIEYDIPKKGEMKWRAIISIF